MVTPVSVAPTVLDGSENRNSQAAQVAQEFEAVFLSQFVDEMMKTVEFAPQGAGQGGDIWRSFFSQELADSITEQGGIGLARNIQDIIAAYTSHT